MADEKKKSIEIKSIESSNLSPEELSKAIESTTEDVLKKANRLVIKTDNHPESAVPVEQPVSDNEVSPVVGVILKNRPYVRDSDKINKSNNNTNKEEAELKPPSQTQKVVAELTDEQKQDKSPDQEANGPKTVQTEVTSSDETKISQDLAEDNASNPSKPDSSQITLSVETAQSSAPKAPIAKNTLGAVDLTQNSLKVDEELPTDKNQAEAQGEQPKQPAIYDTNQYHLPIKTRSKRYMNNVLAWTLLTLFLVGVVGYVLIEIEVIDISSLSF